MSRCRALVLGLPPFGSAHRFETQGLERVGIAPEPVEEARRIAVVFEGIVLDPHGAPTEGAVVICSAGGQAATDRSGKYRLEVNVSVEALELRVTAVGAGGVAANRIAKWDGSSWSPLGSGTNDEVLASTVFNDRTGPALHAGGRFTSAPDSGDSYLAKWGCRTRIRR
jgi:hypothetical protein